MSKYPLLLILVSSFLTTGLSAQKPPIITNGLIGLWHLNGNTNDSSGNGHNGTIIGTVTQTAGKFGNAYHFDGSSAIDCGNVDLNSTGEFSVSAWVKSNDSYTTEVWRMVVSKLDGSAGGPLELHLGDGRNTTGLQGTSTNYLAWNGGIGLYYTFSPYDLSKNAKDGNWHHLAVTFKSGSQIVYFDGNQVGSSTSTDALPNTSSNFRIGGIDFGPYHHPLIGDIDEVSAYNRALSSSEIQTLAGGGSNSTDSTVAWKLTGNSNASDTSRLGTTNAVPLNLATNNLTRLRIDQNGKIGVNTTTPATLFHVNGFGAFGNRVTTSNATRALNLADDNAVVRVLRVHPTSAPAVELISRTSADGANVAYWDMYAQPSDASFRIRDRQGPRDRDRLTISHTTGNVGIGISNPGYPLTVTNTNSPTVLYSTSSFSGSDDRTAVYGLSVNNPGWGIGVEGIGGYWGVYGVGQGSSSSDNFPVVGVVGAGTGDAGVGTRIGVLGSVSGGNIGYGVYGAAGNAATFNAAGYFDGDVYAANYYSTSDRKFKKDITPMQHSLEQIMKLKPSAYQFKTTEFKGMHLPAGRQMGLIADEVRQVFPELVQTVVHPAVYGKDKTEPISKAITYEAVNYQGFIPVLISSLQELNKKTEENNSLKEEVDELKKQVSDLQDKMQQMEAFLTSNRSNAASANTSAAYLEQNAPNPFSSATIIRYTLPQNTLSANLVITDMTGIVVKTIALNNNRGKGQITLNAGTLVAGTYSYSLYVENKLMATRRMIMTR